LKALVLGGDVDRRGGPRCRGVRQVGYVNPKIRARMTAANRLTGAARRAAWADIDAAVCNK